LESSDPAPIQGFPVQGDGSVTPQQLASRRMSRARIVCGVLWGLIAAVIGVGGVAELTIGNVGGAVVCLVVGVGSGWYDYRVWTFKARRLLFIIM
jgi:hypothetical protein